MGANGPQTSAQPKQNRSLRGKTAPDNSMNDFLNSFLASAGFLPQAPAPPVMPQAAPRQRNTYVPGSYAPLSSMFVGSGQRGYGTGSKAKSSPQGNGPQPAPTAQGPAPNPFMPGDLGFIGPLQQQQSPQPYDQVQGWGHYQPGGLFGRRIEGQDYGAAHDRNPWKNWNVQNYDISRGG